MVNNRVSEQCSYQYTGQEFDWETGLHNYRARMYDSSIMNFLSIDPLHEFANPYSYVGSNTVNFIDPTGMQDQPCDYNDQYKAGRDETNEFNQEEADAETEQASADSTGTAGTNSNGTEKKSSEGKVNWWQGITEKKEEKKKPEPGTGDGKEVVVTGGKILRDQAIDTAGEILGHSGAINTSYAIKIGGKVAFWASFCMACKETWEHWFPVTNEVSTLAVPADTTGYAGSQREIITKRIHEAWGDF